MATTYFAPKEGSNNEERDVLAMINYTSIIFFNLVYSPFIEQRYSTYTVLTAFGIITYIGAYIFIELSLGANINMLILV
jgi:hypothetical protein